MARYIDANRLISKIHELYVQPNIELWQVLKCVGNSPTADVVPKSESLPLDVHEALKQRAVEKAKTEFAREIFAEIDTLIFGTIIPNDCAIISTAKLAELKKKYTEGESYGN